MNEDNSKLQSLKPEDLHLLLLQRGQAKSVCPENLINLVFATN